MNKKIEFTNLKTGIIIFCGVAILGGYVTIKYFNQKPSKNVSNPVQTAEPITSPETSQSVKTTEKAETTKPQETTSQTGNKKLTSDNAVEIVKNIVIKNKSNTKAAFDRIETKDGNNYYVIRLYESMPDHSVTLGWFYVHVDTGKAFEWDLTNDKLTPIN